MKKLISNYCKQDVPGWEKLPLAEFGMQVDDRYFWSFWNRKEGIQFTCDVKKGFLHVSVAPMGGSVTEEEILAKAPIIIKEFCGDLAFVRGSDDPRRTQVKHFVSCLVDYRNN